MVKKRLKAKYNIKSNSIDNLLEKYNIPKEYTAFNRRMISRGAFIGLFIAMIPMPFQMVAVFFFTFVGKFNFPVAIAMCWLTNPFTMPFIYYIEYQTGAFLLGMEIKDVVISLEWFNDNFSKIVVPLYTGALFYSIVLSTLVYNAINLYWIRKVYEFKDLKKK